MKCIKKSNSVSCCVLLIFATGWSNERQGGPHKKNKIPLIAASAANAIESLVVRWPTLKLEHYTHIFSCAALFYIYVILVAQVSVKSSLIIAWRKCVRDLNSIICAGRTAFLLIGK